MVTSNTSWRSPTLPWAIHLKKCTDMHLLRHAGATFITWQWLATVSCGFAAYESSSDFNSNRRSLVRKQSSVRHLLVAEGDTAYVSLVEAPIAESDRTWIDIPSTELPTATPVDSGDSSRKGFRGPDGRHHQLQRRRCALGGTARLLRHQRNPPVQGVFTALLVLLSPGNARRFEHLTPTPAS